MFALTNEQRPCFGLSPVQPGWKRIDVKPSPYDTFNTVAYVDEGMVLRKAISSGKDIYQEMEYREQLSGDGSLLLPRTEKGKPVKLSSSTLLKRVPAGMGLRYSRKNISLGNYISNQYYYHSDHEILTLNTINDFSAWVEKWCAESSSDDLEEVAAFARRKRIHCKYREGDFFRFRLTRRLYGYGRILVDYVTMRRNKQPFWDILMTTPLAVCVYPVISDNKDVSPEELAQLTPLPSQFMADNPLFYGTYEIIGNLPFEEEPDCPIMYGAGLSISDPNDAVFFQRGKTFIRLDGQSPLFRGFTNNGVSFSLDVLLPDLEDCIRQGSNAPYWYSPYRSYYQDKDLRHPKNRAKLEAVCAQLGLPLPPFVGK